MPNIKVEGQTVAVPDFKMPGSDIFSIPEVKEQAKGNRTVFLVNPETQGMEIVDPNRQYEIREGTQIATTAPSVSGGC